MLNNTILAELDGRRLPRWQEIPDVGLYLKQAVRFISNALEPLYGITVTESMLSNYVKQGLVPNPVKKQYFREQIAILLFISVAKTVLSLDNIRIMLQMQRQYYPLEVSYEYFCTELESVVSCVFGLGESMESIGGQERDIKYLLRAAVIAIAHKVYLERCFLSLSQEDAQL